MVGLGVSCLRASTETEGARLPLLHQLDRASAKPSVIPVPAALPFCSRARRTSGMGRGPPFRSGKKGKTDLNAKRPIRRAGIEAGHQIREPAHPCRAVPPSLRWQGTDVAHIKITIQIEIESVAEKADPNFQNIGLELARLAGERDSFTKEVLQAIGRQWELELKEHLGAILQRHGPALTIVK